MYNLNICIFTFERLKYTYLKKINLKHKVVLMKALILAGGLGTRLSEETNLKPKPMVEVGGKPILWHVMKIYSYHGVNDFLI